MILLSRFIEHGSCSDKRTDTRLKEVMDYIDNHLDSIIELDTLADMAGMSKAYLIRIFKKDHGLTPLAYMNRRRMEKAQLMLLTTDLPVKDIAYELGFTDSSYFNRIFKQHIGCTPQAYRVRN